MKFLTRSLILALITLFSFSSHATEGMWIPSLLKAIEDDMQAMGLELSADDIYNINTSSLKDAIVHFGGGCTAEIISSEGLILTNHHCGYSQIQSHSTLENNYLKDGFWAMNKTSELKNDGLTATIIDKILDVTDKMNAGITSEMTNDEAAAVRESNRKKIEEEATEKNISGAVRAYNYGNSYFLITSITFRDVRLVGAPPSAVGKFGGDLDNWVWPRHTGDFSMFRIYTDAKNNPADYSENNKPYSPKQHLSVSLDGVEEGDFTMVFGFPGRTEQYLTSEAVKYVTEISNPMKIHMRDESLSIIDLAMRNDENTFIKYASKQSSISNAWKKWKGQSRGLARMGALQRKQNQESEFLKRATSKGKEEYYDVIQELNELQLINQDFKQARELYIEYFYYGPEIVGFGKDINDFCDLYLKALEENENTEELKQKYLKKAKNHFKDYDIVIDKDIFKALTPLYSKYLKDVLEPAIFLEGKNNWSTFTEKVFKKSILTSYEKIESFINKSSKGAIKKYKKSLASRLSASVVDVFYQKALPEFRKNNAEIGQKMKLYVKGLSELFPENTYWSDANSTLRLTYGKAEGSEPNDGMAYKFYTTAQGILDKNSTGHADYELPERLIKLLKKEDYGVYAHSDGTLRVCFTGSNHTTGGNSGSPALNSKGHLVGLNFDRSWESTMSDIMFDPEQCRNIMVDIRYILWFIDNYAGASHLIEEMTLIKEGEDRADTENTVRMEKLEGEDVMVLVERMPYFKTCQNNSSKKDESDCTNTELIRNVSKNITYPEFAKENNIEGTVYVEFVVDKTGKITRVKLLRGAHKTLNDEAVSAVEKLPSMMPGLQRGKPVNVQMRVPVKFVLN